MRPAEFGKPAPRNDETPGSRSTVGRPDFPGPSPLVARKPCRTPSSDRPGGSPFDDLTATNLPRRACLPQPPTHLRNRCCSRSVASTHPFRCVAALVRLSHIDFGRDIMCPCFPRVNRFREIQKFSTEITRDPLSVPKMRTGSSTEQVKVSFGTGAKATSPIVSNTARRSELSTVQRCRDPSRLGCAIRPRNRDSGTDQF